MHLWSLIVVQSISSPWPRTQWYKGWDHGQFNNICSDCSGCDVDVSVWNFSTATEIAALHPRSNIAFRLDLLILWQIRTSVDSSVLSVTDTGERQFLDVFGHGKWGRSAAKGPEERLILEDDNCCGIANKPPDPSLEGELEWLLPLLGFCYHCILLHVSSNCIGNQYESSQYQKFWDVSRTPSTWSRVSWRQVCQSFFLTYHAYHANNL